MKFMRHETEARERPDDFEYDCPGCNGAGCEICDNTGKVVEVHYTSSPCLAHPDVGYAMGLRRESPAYKRKQQEIARLQKTKKSSYKSDEYYREVWKL